MLTANERYQKYLKDKANKADDANERYQKYLKDKANKADDANERYQKYRASLPTNKVDEDYINNYIADFSNYAKSSQSDYNKVEYGNVYSYSEKYKTKSSNLIQRANAIEGYLNTNKDKIDSDLYKKLSSYISQSKSAIGTTQKAFDDVNKYYSQWDTEEDYNRYIVEQKYSTLDEDTFNLVKVVATGQNARSTTEGLMGFFSYWGDLLDGNPSTYNAQKNQVAQGNAAREQLKKMGYSDTEINTWVSMNIDGRVQESQESTKQFAKEHPVLSSAISVPYKAITAPVEAALAIDNVVRGDTDVAKSANDVLAMDDYTRKVISDKIADDSKVGAWFYDVGMSTADSMFAALMPGEIGVALLGVDVASHTTNDLLERGADPTKALFGGIAAGAFETIFERISIGNFKALQAVKPKTIKQVAGNLAKSMGVNASEEGLTEIANIVYDTLVNGSISNYQLAIDKYMADGMSPGEAKKQAIKDLAWQVGEATLSGAVQGGGMGVTGTAIAYGKHKASQIITGSHIKAGNSMEAVIAAAKTLPTDSKVYKEAVKIEGKVANGEKVSSHEIGRLFSNTQDYIADNSAVTEGTFRGVNSLEELDRAYEQMKYDESKKVGGKNRETRKALESLAKEYEAAKTKLQKIEESNSADIAQAASDAFTQAQMRVMSGESTESNSDVDTDNAETSSVDSQVMALAQQTASAEAGVAPTEFNTNPAPAEFNEDNLEEYKNSATLDIPVSQEHQLSDIEGKTIIKNTNEAVNIKKITSIDKNSMTLELDDGREVSSKDISYASEGEALVYETVADITNSAESANAIINAFDVAKPKNANAWAAGARMVYTDGKNSIPFSEIAKQDFTSYLSNEAKKLIYNLGQQDAITETAKAEKAKKTTNKKAKGKGRVTFEGKENFSTDGFTDVQRASVAYANVISKITGVEVRLYESEKVNGRFVYTDENGEVKAAPNGKYIPGSNIIMLDINAGENGEGTMLYTLAHELTHYIKEWSPAKFKSLANFLMEQYGKQGQSVDELVQAQIRKAKSNRKTIDYDTAYEEVIADSMESMLTDGKVIEKLQQLYKQDKSLYRKIVDFVNKWVDKVKQLYTEYSPNSKEGKLVLEMKDSLEELQSKFAEALMDATVNYTNAKSELVNIDAASESASPKLSERTWTASSYVVHREATAQMLAQTLGVTKKKALEYIDNVNSIARLIADDRVRLDYEASPFGSAFVSNSEYGGSFDFTTLCKKRRLYTGTFSEIQKRLGDVALTPDHILEIRNMLTEAGKEATCGLCYVEGSRANMGKFAKEFIRLYKRDNPDAWIPSMYDVNTPDGVESMKRMHPEAYEQYEFFWNHYGKLKADDKALFASQQKPKLYESRKEYKGEILEHFSKDTTVQAKNRNGGIRMQSFSDFELVHLIDTMQIIMDMASVGLSGQAYTKVPEFADAFGNTGLKINLSLIAKGVDENGKLIFDDREGMPHETAFGLRNKYSKNVGTIIVTFTDEQLYAAMADSRIDFIIPFHRSQWKKGQYQAMGLPQGTKDYTYMQNEKLIKQTYHEYRGKMVKDKASNYMPNEYWDFSKSGKENAEAYLEMCAKENKRPKFYKLLDYDGKGTYSLKKDGSTDGYWKLLIDFKMYDNNGVGSAQQPVTPNFSIDEAIEMLNEYKGGHQSYPVAHDVVDRFVESYNATNKNPTSDSDVRYSFRDSKSGTANDALSPYDDELTRFIHQKGDYIVNSFEKLEQIVNLAFDSPSIQATAYLGIVDVKTLEKIKNNVPNLPKALGGKLFKEGRSYSIALTLDSIRHMVDDKSLSREDVIDYLDRFADTIVDFDSVAFAYYTKGESNTPGLLFKKSYPDGIVMSFTLVSNNKRSMVLQSLYMDNANYQKKKSAKTLLMQNASSNTSKTQVGQTSNKSVPNSTTKSQEKLSDRDPDAITTRGLLADALESTAANDIERKKLADYKKKAKLMTAEEAKLAELRKQIKEASFSKGKRDTEKLKQLKEEATKAANRITTYDRQLLNLESTQAIKNVLEREKKKAVEKQKQRDKEALKAYKEQVEQKQQKIIENYRESRQNATESRHRTEMRNKIKKVVNELNQYLLKGTKDKHVSEGMQTAVAEALSIVNMDTVDADARVAKYDALIAEATDPDVIESLTATRDRIQGQGDNLKSKLEALQLGYAKIKQSSDPSLASAYNKGIEDKIASVVDVVGNTPLRNMSMNQLEEVYDLYKLVLTSIRDRNKMFVTAQKETVQELGIEAKTELSEVSKKIEYINSVNKLLRKIGYKDLKPIYFFRMLGSKTMTKLYKAVSNGQGTWYKDMREAKSFRIKAEKEHNYKNWDMKKTYSFTSNSGSSFKLTLQQIMTIYAYYRRDEEKAIRHLVDGGFVFDKSISVIKKEKGVPVKYYVNTAEAFNLSETIINNIISTLSDEQRAYVEKMQAYLSDTMGAKGNEVSLKLYDVKLFKEKNYFPIKSSSTYMDYNPEESGEVKIKNSGFTKATNQFANNPIVLSDFIDVWTSHVNDMSMYHAFVLPLEDFTRVYNYRNITDRRGAIQATIETNYTEAANSYIKQLLKDINGGSVSGVGTEVIDKMVGLAKKGAVFASASVTVQQPSAIARAMAYVNPKYFVNVSSFNLKRHNQLWEECKQYAPVAGIKEMGYFDTSVGRTGIDWLKSDEFDSFGEKFVASFKSKEQFKNSANDVLSFFPSMADELTWVSIWEAVKKETRKTTDLEVGSEEFFKHCGERFTEVVDLTQVYDSVFSRSELMRSKDRSVKMATSFMAEPTVQANMLFDAVLQLKRGKMSALGSATSVVSAVVASVILNSLLKSFVTAGRDDDEEETYLEKYVASFTSDVLNGLNPLTLIPFVKDFISIVQGYSVDRMDMTVIESLITSIMALGKEAETPADKHKKWSNFVGAVTQLFGIPAKNIIRDFTGIFNTYKIFTSGNKTTETGVKYALLEGLSETPTAILTDKLSGGKFGIDVSKGKQYYDAVINGDTEHAKKIVDSYGDAKKADAAIVKALRDHDPRVREAAQAQIDGDNDKRIKLSKEIIADGFKQDYVVKAVNAEINALKNGEEEEYSLKSQSLYTKEDYFNAALEGNSADAEIYKQEIIRVDMENNGKTEEEAEESFYNSFKGLVKKSIKEGRLTIERAANVLANYGGLSAEKAFETAQYYDFTAQNPDLAYNWTSTTVAGYLETAEPAGISVEVYDDYLVKKSQCKGVDRNNDGKADKGTKKAQIYKMIDSLPITSHQKAVLKLMNK